MSVKLLDMMPSDNITSHEVSDYVTFKINLLLTLRRICNNLYLTYDMFI